MNKGLIRHWMTPDPKTISPTTRLSDARRIMDAEKFRVLPIMKEGELVGIITRRGLLRTDISPLSETGVTQPVDLSQNTVDTIMTTNVLTITPSAPLPKAARIMMENKITALPVMEGKKLVGIITTSDLFRFIIEEVPLLKENIQVNAYMTSEVVCVPPDTSLLETHRLMGVRRIRSLLVTQENHLIGIVTRTDLLSADPSRFLSKNNQELSEEIERSTVEKIMTRGLLIVRPNTNITEAASLMLTNKIHSLPVLEQDGGVAGIITEVDLFRMIVQKFA
jgi:acetoin utilization protein AcuB